MSSLTTALASPCAGGNFSKAFFFSSGLLGMHFPTAHFPPFGFVLGSAVTKGELRYKQRAHTVEGRQQQGEKPRPCSLDIPPLKANPYPFKTLCYMGSCCVLITGCNMLGLISSVWSFYIYSFFSPYTCKRNSAFLEVFRPLILLYNKYLLDPSWFRRAFDFDGITVK